MLLLFRQAPSPTSKLTNNLATETRFGLEYWSVKRDVIPDNGSDEAITLLKAWIDDCVENHAECRDLDSTQTQLPTRVIDVGSIESLTVKLFVTNSLQAPYVALSHCWGKLPLLNTTKSTLEERQRAIPIESLPQAFQDAVTITRKLGLQYVWIDSLCIVQDDANDWDIEAAQMADVYGRAFLTISNDWADGSTKPILRPYDRKDPKMLDPFITRMMSTRVRRPIDHEGDRGPISSRAWTLQERVLSKRIIHYEAEEMRFECRKGAKCECSDYQMPIRSRITRSTGPLQPSTWPSDLDERLRIWFDLVEEYSNRNLSFGADKLPAFYGIAQRLQTGGFGFGKYAAGLWEGAMLVCLLWTTAYQLGSDEYPTGQKDRPSTFRAPTWSWASIDAQTWYQDDHLHLMKTATRRCEVYDYHIIPSGNAGAVKAAQLRIRSFVIPVELELNEDEKHRRDHQQQWRMIAGDTTCGFTPDAPTYDLEEVERLQRKELPMSALASVSKKKRSTWKKMFTKDKSQKTPAVEKLASESSNRGQILCILLAHGSNTYQHRNPESGSTARAIPGENNYQGLGLVIKPSSHVEGAYERIGLVVLYDWASHIFHGASEKLLPMV